MKIEAMNDATISHGPSVDLVIKVRRLMAQLRAVGLIMKINTPVMPSYPADLAISELECAAMAEDPEILEDLYQEFWSLVRAYGPHLEHDHERDFAAQTLKELLGLCVSVRRKAEGDIALHAA